MTMAARLGIVTVCAVVGAWAWLWLGRWPRLRPFLFAAPIALWVYWGLGR